MSSMKVTYEDNTKKLPQIVKDIFRPQKLFPNDHKTNVKQLTITAEGNASTISKF